MKAKAKEPEAPVVLSNTPPDGALGVALNESINVIFDVRMDPATLNDTTFTLTLGGLAVDGTVIHFETAAGFRPTALLASDSVYTATVTTGAQSSEGLALEAAHTWSFTTGNAVVPRLPVNLGTAGDFAVLAKSGISTVPASAITGDIGVSPAAASFITGFSLIADATNEFATSTQVTGQVFAADFAPPTPTKMTTAVSDMELAFTDAAGRAPDVIELGAGNIGGLTLTPGVYKWGTGLLVPTTTNVTLAGTATDVWIFQIAGDLTMGSGAQVLMDGAVPQNVFWQVAGFVELGTTAHLEGIVLTQTAVTLQTGASANGRLLAQTAVTMDAATIVQPAN